MSNNILDYEILEKLYESANSIIYRVSRKTDTRIFILKQLNNDHPKPAQLFRFKHEYELISKLNLNGVIRPFSLEKYNNTLIMVLEDLNGEPLTKLIPSVKSDLSKFFDIAIQVSEVLGQLHQKNILHKDINPSNILWNQKTSQVKIIDFGISTELPRENPEVSSPNLMDGTLLYMSPEQTGRMNRTMDYRTDLYSLGVTFYEMLTGEVPFKSNDPMEIIHSHIAKEPVSPCELNPAIPKILSNIVLKLLSKAAEDRYQNSFGLLFDLKECAKQLKDKGKIESFELAKKDIAIKFHVPQKLVGREEEIESLMSSFERASTGHSEIMLVLGSPGIGKSALINEIHKPIVAKRGYFISGKYEQFRKDVSYSAIIQAFQGLIRQILTESEEKITIWKKELLEALGPNGKVITNIIPEVESIIGIQPDLADVGSEASQNRFNYVFKNFVQVFAKNSHPLAMFLDDLQWADYASLNLIKTILTDADIKFLFFIGAYRHNEVDESHFLNTTLNEVKKQGVKVNSITLSTLDIDNVNKLIANFMRCKSEESYELAELVYRKTNGNPFFVSQFLKSLYDGKLLEIDPIYGWKWDLNEISKLQVTDNVVELLAKKLITLPEKTQELLKISSCIGNRFKLETLSFVCNKPIEDIFPDLHPALNEEFIYASKDMFHFLHDRIQEAAYSLIPAKEKSNLHYNIGRHVLANTAEDKLKNNIFYIVNHLNLGSDIVKDLSEKVNISTLNLKAGKWAKAAAAFEPAYNYAKKGIELLPDDSWQTHYDLTLELYVEATETAYMITKFENMEILSEVVMKNARTLLDKVRIYEVKINACHARNEHFEAVKIGLNVLRLLGINFPTNPGKIRVLLGLLRVKTILRNKKIESLIDLPECKDPYILSIFQIQSAFGVSCYQVSIELLILSALKTLELSVKHGNSKYSPFSYVSFGCILCGLLFDIKAGYEFGTIAIKIMDCFPDDKRKSDFLFSFNNFIKFWKEHLKETFPSFMESYQLGLNTGNLEFAAFSAQNYCTYSYFSGKELPLVEQELIKYGDSILKLKQKMPYQWNRIYLQMVSNLMGRSESPIKLSGKFYSESEMIPIHLKSKDKSALFEVSFQKVILCYLLENFDLAIENTNKAKVYLEGAQGVFTYAIFHFYESLSYLAIYQNVSIIEKLRIILKVKSNQKKMRRWADHAPMNFLHKYYL